MRWRKKTEEPNADLPYVARSGDSYFRVEKRMFDGKKTWCYYGIGLLPPPDFEYLEVYNENGVLNPNDIWKPIETEEDENGCPIWNMSSLPKDNNSKRSSVCAFIDKDKKIRAGYFNFSKRQYIILGREQISPVAFCDIEN